jgi:hypothetical protein
VDRDVGIWRKERAVNFETILRLPPRRRRLLGVLAAVVLAATAVVAEASVQSAHAAACSGGTGVTEVVDFTALGGGIETACNPGDPTTGLAALTGAGFTYSFVPRFPGFICRINALPNPCNGAPATAYWSYWHASPGGTWTYSTLGAGSYDPSQGSDEGWAFGDGNPPGISPP